MQKTDVSWKGGDEDVRPRLAHEKETTLDEVDEDDEDGPPPEREQSEGGPVAVVADDDGKPDDMRPYTTSSLGAYLTLAYILGGFVAAVGAPPSEEAGPPSGLPLLPMARDDDLNERVADVTDNENEPMDGMSSDRHLWLLIVAAAEEDGREGEGRGGGLWRGGRRGGESGVGSQRVGSLSSRRASSNGALSPIK